MSSLISIVTLSLVTAVSAAIGPEANLHIINGNIAPDGFARSAVLASGTGTDTPFPGVLITAQKYLPSTKGDRMKINVTDSLNDTTMLTSTSIHWHGLFQNGSSWADGSASVTQCPILPGNSFLYEFDVGDQAGTFWYHSHSSTQYCDGLRGPIIIYDPNDPFRELYDVDDENTVITVSDWYHQPAPSIHVVPSIGLVPMPNSTLINGLGRYLNGDATPLAVINTIIEVDGVNHEPLTVDSIQIFAGQRYSVVVAADQPIGNYWVRAKPNIGPTTFEGGLNSAILRYQGADIADPQTNSALSNPLVETDLHPLENPGAPGGSGPADISYYLDVQLVNDQYTMNNVTFTAPTVPVLLQILSGARLATDLLPKGSVYTLPRNKTVELIIPGGVPGSPHPFHLHGHTFDVVRSAGSTLYNYVNPVRRDVVDTGYTGDNVTIRFTTDNPGPWFLHCHIDWHLEMGMAIVFAEDLVTIANSTQPPAWKDLCPLYNNRVILD
ncbi:hypothetical protein C0995_010025 [Termitomyces sp. Mi166|nr:hypothetical protein C0995_010025 [Termitomyces sp. Mi166\